MLHRYRPNLRKRRRERERRNEREGKRERFILEEGYSYKRVMVTRETITFAVPIGAEEIKTAGGGTLNLPS